MDKTTGTDCLPINEDAVNDVKQGMLSYQFISRTALFYKVVGDETRLRILYALSIREMCVNDISVVLNMTKSAVSHQLKLLKTAGQVKSRRDGKNVYYSLDDQHMVDILEVTLEHIKHKFTDDNN